MEVLIEDLIIMDPDNSVIGPEVDRLFEVYGSSGGYDPIPIFHQNNGTFYVRGGCKEIIFMLYNRAKKERVLVECDENYCLDSIDLGRIQKSQCRTIHELGESYVKVLGDNIIL